MALADQTPPPEQLLETPNLADALESDRFKQFLDHMPFGVAVAELRPSERIIYVNLEMERLVGLPSAEIEGRLWDVFPNGTSLTEASAPLSEAIASGDDYVGMFSIHHDEKTVTVDAWSNVIADDDGTPTFRLVALATTGKSDSAREIKLREKDTLLRELQHRVKNNLQMITALIRMEVRNLPDDANSEVFNRLAGRIESLALLYSALANDEAKDSVDLGVYISQIASAVMSAHAPEGIRLDMKVDTWPASIDVAMPAGLVVNELLTNSLKHAFVGREGGTLTLRSVVEDGGCRVTVADDGVGLKEGDVWPKAGKLSSLIVRSLKQNAKAQVTVDTGPGKGVRVTIFFAKADAAPS